MELKIQKEAARQATGSKRYRLAIYDVADESVPLDFVGRELTDCPEDWCYTREAIDEFNAYVARIPHCTHAMSLFELAR